MSSRSRHVRCLWAVAILSMLLTSPATAQDEMVANPYYKFWAKSKPGDTVVHLEQTKLSEPEGKLVADGIDEKRITYKLIEVHDDRAVVEMVVTERDFLGYIQAAPTRYIYPATLKKSQLDRILSPTGTTTGEETLEVAGQEMTCRTLAGRVSGPDGEQIDYKVWLSEGVPGSIVRQLRTARHDNELIAETTTTLQSGT